MHLQRCIREVGTIFKMSFLQYHRGTWYFAGKYEMSSLSSGTANGSGRAVCTCTEDAHRKEALRGRAMGGGSVLGERLSACMEMFALPVGFKIF